MKLLTMLALLAMLVGCDRDGTDSAADSELADESSAELSSAESARQKAGRSLSEADAELAARAGAPLFAGMGDYAMAITTRSQEAQRYFNQGMVLAFAFNHAESVRSFQAAQKLDPTCAMCFWGEALATGPNINVTSNGKAVMAPDDRIAAQRAIGQALALMAGSTELERALIGAQAYRYNGDPDTSREPLDAAYAKAMGEVAAKYPENVDVASLYAEALMNTMPWNYWAEDGNPREDTVKVIESLERVIATDPKHPLALHLYIHAVEASSTPERAEPAADTLADLVPGAGHLVHMPAHIYWRVGRYFDASEANIRAAAVDEEYIAQCNAQGFYPALYYPHNIHFLWAASTMEGRSKLSIESAHKVADNVSLEQIQQFPTIEFFKTIPLLSYVRFGKWDEILAYPAPPENLAYSKGIWHYARGVALARTGELAAAEQSLAAIAPLRADMTISFLDERDYPASLILSIAEGLLAGDIHLANGDDQQAVSAFQQAVDFQDQLPYTEPPFWYYPTRQSLGYALMQAGEYAQAEAVYRRDLKDYPRNGWSIFGLAQALESQGDQAGADAMMKRFGNVWQMADIELSGSVIAESM